MTKISILNFVKETIPYIFNNNQKYLKWGAENDTPNVYLQLYENVVEHSSSINFILNKLIYEGIETLDYWTTQKLSLDYLIFGGFAVEVIKKRNGNFQLNYIDISKLRYNPEKNKLGYSTNWSNYKSDVKWYDISPDVNIPGIYLYTNPKSRYDYPTPYWLAAKTNLETMQNIIEYHNNNSENGFTASVIINMNNGEPDAETKKEIEKKIEEKFTGVKGKKFLISYNDSKESATEIIKLEADNLDEKFESLQKFIQEQIFIAHQITSPTLIGKLPENNGFSKVEYEESMEIFKQNVIKTLRKELEYGFTKLFNKEILIKEEE